jgi:hypothetical protein
VCFHFDFLFDFSVTQAILVAKRAEVAKLRAEVMQIRERRNLPKKL